MRSDLFWALHKLANSEKFLEKHFSSPSWDEFQQRLRSKGFVQAVESDPRSDTKLKRFAENIGRHKQAKGVPSFPVPSQSSGKSYTVKYHPDVDRFSCNCGDWTYAKSWQEGKGGRDCKHIKMVQLELKAQGKPLTKKAEWSESFLRLSRLMLG